MVPKVKISPDIPAYLKKWIDGHDLSQNALVTMGLRRLYLDEKNTEPKLIIDALIEHFDNKKLPF